MSSRHTPVPKVLSLAARVVTICFLVLQFSFAGVVAKFAGSHPDAGVFCLNQTIGETTPTHPAPATPVSQHHSGDCCFLSFGDLTPIVIAMLRALGFNDKATLAFVMAAGFIADTASLPLVVSNLVNIVSADFFRIGFGDYASVMVPVDLVSIAATLGALLLFFRRDIPADYDVGALRAPRDAIRDAATFRAGWIVLALLLAGFFLLEPLGVPVSAVAAAGAILLLVIAGRGHVIPTAKVLRGAPWQVVIFSLGMYLVVYGLRNAGLTDHLAALLDRTAQGGVWGAALGTGVIAAVLSSVMNNMPTVLVGALSIDATHASGAIKEAMIYANVIGCDLGPKLTPIGSLATLLWLHVLGQKGVRIGWGYYFRVGVTLTVPVLLITLAALAIRISIA